MLTEKDAVNGWARFSPHTDIRLTTAMAVLGPNASGKSSLVQPLAFLGWFIRHSFHASPDSGVPVVPHFSNKADATDFEVIADANEKGSLFRYRLKTTSTRVISESLEKKVRRGQWRTIFERQEALNGKYFVRQEGLGLDETQAQNVRPNVSLISWAAQFGVPLAADLASFSLTTNMNFAGRVMDTYENIVSGCAKYYDENPHARERMRELLASWDLGLTDISFVRLNSGPRSESNNPAVAMTPEWVAHGMHTDSAGEQHSIPLWQESAGTRSALSLLTNILPVLEHGGVVAYDELDSDLHPHMIIALLDLFSDKETNPNSAQIIFSCHSAEVLRLLQKSQIILVEKNQLQSQAWRLDSVDGIRSDENRVAKYLAGAYGAIPRI